MSDWDHIDAAAEREGMALSHSFTIRRPNRPRGVSKEDVKRASGQVDILQELGVIGGKRKCER